jgi:hypothetical protein
MGATTTGYWGRALIAALVAAAGALLLPSASSAASRPNREFFGTQSWHPPTVFEAPRMAQGGIGTFRFALNWSSVQSSRGGPYRWERYDTIVNELCAAGIRAFPAIAGSPRWAAEKKTYPPIPEARADYARFVRAAVDHFGPNGKVCPSKPVRAWQVWNEPNFPTYSSGRTPSPAAYVAHLSVTHKAVKSRDPKAQVVLAGLANSNVFGSIRAATYLDRLYALGAAPFFDVAAIHPYAGTVSSMEYQIQAFRRVMKKYGDAGSPLWVSEFGWASSCSCKKGSPFNAGSYERQAKLAGSALKFFIRTRFKYRIRMVAWYVLRDRRMYSRDKTRRWSLNAGLFTLKGKPKPAWRTVASIMGGVGGYKPIPGPPPKDPA